MFILVNYTSDKKSDKMDSTIEQALKTMGFQDITVIPKMKEIRKKWLLLSLITHPDKNGSNQAFQDLLEAYEILCEEAKKTSFDENDIEENVTRKMYNQFRVSCMKENLQTFTLTIEKETIKSWELILTLNFLSLIFFRFVLHQK